MSVGNLVLGREIFSGAVTLERFVFQKLLDPYKFPGGQEACWPVEPFQVMEDKDPRGTGSSRRGAC